MNRSDSNITEVDVTVVGSGFAGTIAAMCLKQMGYSVAVIERGKHPRFSIGESSTPIADMILRTLSESYNLPFLKTMSRYGTWQKHHPDVVCGLKRGFSYYPHKKGEWFESNAGHENELLVAASFDDENSDTNWLRSDTDHFLAKKVVELGVELLEESEVTSAERENGNWNLHYQKGGKTFSIQSKWIIDATGSSHFSNTFFGANSSPDGFETNSSAVFTHFENAGHWLDYLTQNEFNTNDYPYNPDHSALHQLIEEGWIWMLRFNNDRLSVGIVTDHNSHVINEELAQYWNEIISQYPSVEKIFDNAQLTPVPGRFIHSGRLQRKLNKSYGDGWFALSHTYGFVDPLHSTGIAYSLCGVERILSQFKQRKFSNSENIISQDKLDKELRLIDKIVSSSYLSRPHFKLFGASVMLYFITSIRYEQSRLRGEIPDTFLCAGDSDLIAIVEETHSDIKKWNRSGRDPQAAESLISVIRKRIAPYNPVGLMDPAKKNMYSHTAIEL